MPAMCVATAGAGHLGSSTTCRFIDDDKDEWVLRRMVELAKAAGLLKRRGKGLMIALDTTPVIGAGAVRDAINLSGDAIRRLLRNVDVR